MKVELIITQKNDEPASLVATAEFADRPPPREVPLPGRSVQRG